MPLKIYTKKGDTGKTSLIGGTRVSKSHLRIDSYGTIDELNACIALVIDHLQDNNCKAALKEVQDRLFTIGSSLACDPDKEPLMRIPDLKETDIGFLESEIDRMQSALPVMKHFILPGGHVAVSVTHLARTVCRRAERVCVNMQEQHQFIEPLVIKYLNRLSDYLFVLSRFIAQELKVPEVAWMPRL